MSSQFSQGYALLVGVGACVCTAWSLPVTVRDVQALRRVLVDPQRCAYVDDAQHVQLLTNAGATCAAILDGLAWLAACAAADPNATVIVYYSGHGWLDSNSDRYYLIPHDANPADLALSALSSDSFNRALRQIEAKRLLVVLDCCHAAGMATAKMLPVAAPPSFRPAALPKALIAELKQGAGRAVFTSSLGEQRSWVRPDQTMSIFTYHFLEALQGAGNQPGDPYVRLSHVMSHLSKSVPVSAAQLCQADQTPFFDTASEDFPIALVQGGKGGAVTYPVQEEAHRSPFATPSQLKGTRNIVATNLSHNMIVLGDHARISVMRHG